MAKFIVNKDRDGYVEEFEADYFVAGEHFVTFFTKVGSNSEVSVGAINSSSVVTIHKDSH